MLLCKTLPKIKGSWPVYASKYPPVYTYIYIFIQY